MEIASCIASVRCCSGILGILLRRRERLVSSLFWDCAFLAELKYRERLRNNHKKLYGTAKGELTGHAHPVNVRQYQEILVETFPAIIRWCACSILQLQMITMCEYFWID